MKNFGKSFVLASLGFVLFAGVVSAHVTVNPREVTVGYSVATVRVPNEKDVPTTTVRLLVPDGVNVSGIKPVPGWTTSVIREDTQEAADAAEEGHTHKATGRITEVTWSGGLINPGEFQEFPLSVQYAGEGEAVWKAYQTYADGEVVAWDDSNAEKPSSKIAVLKEAKVDTLTQDVKTLGENQKNDAATWLSVAAVLLSGAALFVSLQKKK